MLQYNNNNNNFINVSMYLLFTTNWGHTKKKKKMKSNFVACTNFTVEQ